nr:hypothetical protein [Mycobacterium attenuatum]
MRVSSRVAATTFALTIGCGLGGLAVAPEIQAAPAPVPQWWCPGDFWDPGWGNNWDWNNCHDNWRGPGPNPNGGPGWGPGPGGGGAPGPGPVGPAGPGGSGNGGPGSGH